MLALIRKTHREFGINVLFSSHIMGDIERTCDRILVLDDGRVVHEGEVSSFTRETETVYVEVTARHDEFVAALRERQVEAGSRAGPVVVPDVVGRAVRPRSGTRSSRRARRCAAWLRTVRHARRALPPRGRRRTSAVSAPAEATGRVYDLGFRRYEGPREGRRRAVLAVYKDGLRTAAGLGRGGRAKVVPWLFVGASLIPALVLALIAGAVDRRRPGSTRRPTSPRTPTTTRSRRSCCSSSSP